MAMQVAPERACPGEVLSPELVPLPSPKTSAWSAWDSLLERTPETGFMQSSWWVDFRYTCGFTNFGVTLTDGKDVTGGAVVLKYVYADDLCFYYIQDGPVLPSDPLLAQEIFDALMEQIKEHRRSEPQKVSHLRIEPQWQTLPRFVTGFRPVPPLADFYVEIRDTLRIDLRPSEDEILAQMKPKGRYNIGLAQRHGVSVTTDTSTRGLTDFYRIYEETVERQGIELKPLDYFEALLSFASDYACLFFAEYQGVRVATALAISFGPRATYFYGGSRDIHRSVMAPYLLHFEIMRRAKKLGHEWYDLWGIAPADDPDHPWRNITIFKEKFGGQKFRLVPTLDYVYNRAAYRRYQAFAR